MSAVAVLGAAGFIGHHVVAALVGAGHDVIAIDRRAGEPHPRVRWQVGELDELDAAGARACIHLAEPSAIASAEDGAHNIATARRVLAAAFERIVYASSAVVYGDQHVAPCRETDPVAPVGAYAQAKSAVEAVIGADRRCAILRLANAYGPGMSPANVLSDILAQRDTAGPLRLRDLAPVRDYVHAADVAGAFVAALTASPGLYNVGTGRGTSVLALAQLACAASGRPDREIVGAGGGKPSFLVLEIERARAALGWSPRISLEDGITEMVQRS